MVLRFVKGAKPNNRYSATQVPPIDHVLEFRGQFIVKWTRYSQALQPDSRCVCWPLTFHRRNALTDGAPINSSRPTLCASALGEARIEELLAETT